MADREERALDAYLAAAARLGDRSALAALALRYEKRLLRHAFRLTGESELARDVAQEAWLDIVRSIRRLADANAFAAFAFRITTRRAADAVRRLRRGRAGLAAVAAEPRAEMRLPEDIETNADRAPIAVAIARLPSDQRAVIALFYLEDLSIAEVAAALDVPAGTVKTRLMAARERLKAALGAGKETEDEQA